MRALTHLELKRVLLEMEERPYYRGYDLLGTDLEWQGDIEGDFETEKEYEDDWYCRIEYVISPDYVYKYGEYISNHEVSITRVEVNFETVEISSFQEELLVKALTERANEEYEFYDDEDLHPDYATSYKW